jgi:thioredoxin 1
MKKVENNQDFEQLMNQDNPVLLDFYADWCGPCQSLLPTIEKLSDEYKGKVEIRKVNVDENRELAIKFGVRSIPALFFMKDTEVVDKGVGLVSESELRKKLEVLLN